MKSLWFLVPAHGRHQMATVCLRQLRRTCDTLQSEHEIDAHAVVLADDENLNTASELGFGRVYRENVPLGRKWNDGYELAGREGVDFCVPIGSDDWVDPVWVAQALPTGSGISCSRQLGMVREDGAKIARVRIPYEGGHGIRILPTALIQPLGYRPATEDTPRAVDTHVLRNLRKVWGAIPLLYCETGPFSVVDWKSPGEQLNTYEMCSGYHHAELDDPFSVLADTYPAEALEEMRGVYAGLHR